MEQAANLVTGAIQSQTQSGTPRTGPGRTVSDEEKQALTDAVSKVFAILHSHWPRKFRSIWKTDDDVLESKRVWFLAFRDCEHLTSTTLQAGLAKLRQEGQVWPPDNPGEFLSMCHVEPSDVGAPDFHRAWMEACTGAHARWKRWSHRAVYWAAARTGFDNFDGCGQRVRKEFDVEYQRALDQHETLPEIPRGQIGEVTDAAREKKNEEAARNALAELRKMVGGRA